MNEIEIKKLVVHTDSRGWLAEIFRAESVGGTMKGQVTITTAHPGIVKANHYHKKLNEWYCVIGGKMLLILKDMKTGEKKEVTLSEDDLNILKITPGLAHGFRNIGDKMLVVLMYADRPFNPDDTDTYPETVIE